MERTPLAKLKTEAKNIFTKFFNNIRVFNSCNPCFAEFSRVLNLAYFITATFSLHWLCTVSENKYSLLCLTFIGTLKQLHFMLLFIHFIFQFLHVVLNGVRLLACITARSILRPVYTLKCTMNNKRFDWIMLDNNIIICCIVLQYVSGDTVIGRNVQLQQLMNLFHSKRFETPVSRLSSTNE